MAEPAGRFTETGEAGTRYAGAVHREIAPEERPSAPAPVLRFRPRSALLHPRAQDALLLAGTPLPGERRARDSLAERWLSRLLRALP